MFFYIASSLKQSRDFPTFNNLFNLFINVTTKDKSIHVIKKGFKLILYNNTCRNFFINFTN